MLNRLEQLKSAVADLQVGIELHVEQDGKRISWRFRGTDPNPDIPATINASGSANDEEGAIRDIIAAAHEQLWEGVTLEAPTPDDAVPLPPLDEKLADWGDLPSLTPDEADAEVARLMSNQAEGFDLADEISGLSQTRRNDLTHALHRKKGRMRRERMTGAAPQVEEAAIDHLVDLLARRGV